MKHYFKILVLFGLVLWNYDTPAQIGGISASKLATLCTGTVSAKSIERAENFLIVLNMPFDLYGRNIYKSVGFAMALTITIN